MIKMRYANLGLVEEMCKKERYSLHVNGQIDDVEEITGEEFMRLLSAGVKGGTYSILCY